MSETAPADPEQPPKRRQRIGCLGIVGIAVLVVAAIIGISLWADAAKRQGWADQSGEQSITLTGALTGNGYAISSRATLSTSAEYRETVLHIHVSRPDDSRSQTPMVTVEIDGWECSTYRNYIWSTAEGSDLDLTCGPFLDLDALRATTTGRVLAD